MGVDIQTYRARIGTFKHSRCGKSIENYRQSRSGDVTALVKNIYVSNDMKTAGCLLFIGILLMIAGVEPNPGPMWKDTQVDIPCIRIDGLLENVNKEMLEMFFENEERQGGGKVNSIEIDSKSKCATVVFEEKAAVDAFMQRNSKSILGMDVTVTVLETPQLYHANSTRIKITGLMENINKQMLEMFFDKEERDGGGKVKEIVIDNKDKCVIVDFEDETGVDLIMRKTPMTIFGMRVDIEVIESDIEGPKMVKISKLPANINKEMLLMFFEREIEDDGKVVDVTVNTNDSYAIVEFDKSVAVYGVMDKRPLTIFGFEVIVEAFDARKLVENQRPRQLFYSPSVSKSVKMVDSAVQANLCKCPPLETLSSGKPADDITDTCSTTLYQTACKSIPATKIIPDTSLVVPQHIPRIRISGLNENTNKEMLAMYFEHEERNGGGKVTSIEINQKGKFAMVDFEEKAGADAFMLRNPKSIMGMDVTVEVIDTTSNISHAKSRRIKITGLAANTNKEMLERFFKTEEKKGGGQVNAIFIDGTKKCALIEFKDETGVDWIMKKTPMAILGMEVGIETLDDIDEPKRIQITNLQVIISKEILKMFFENKTDFGGKSIDISITSEENKTIVAFDDSTRTNTVARAEPKLDSSYENEDTVDLETEYAEQLQEETYPFQTTEDTVTQYIESAARIPEPFQTTEGTAFKMECAETNQREVEPLKTSENIVALETESAEQLLEEEEPLQTT
ncbi:uncharacterized protein LOC132743445, partial [Ruditapes philippinarum]|uniref:uncharacterized protein LOC132743445 n=1 Tax=Ruditapes philippinarum TaxID=129788 RepID=UPI00295B8E91